MTIEPTPDLVVGLYALRSFRWHEEVGSIDSSEPLPEERTLAVPSPSPLSPYPEPPVIRVTRRWLEKAKCPDGAATWWDDGIARSWRSPSFHKFGDWLDGTCEARCDVMKVIDPGPPKRYGRLEGHRPPVEKCRCGVYGSLSYADLLSQFGRNAAELAAVIAARGITIMGDRGLRTQFARVVAYWVDTDPIHRQVAAEQFKGAELFENLLEMTEAYGIRLLPPTRKEDCGHSGDANWWTGSGK